MAFFKIIAILILLYGILGFILKITVKPQATLPFYKLSGIGGLILVVLFSLIIKIGAQQVGVVVTPSGVRSTELNTGWHVIMFWNDVFKMDKTTWIYTFAASTTEGAKTKSDAIWSPTADGFKLGYDVSVTWRINPDNASWIYSNVSGEDGTDDARYLWIEENIIRAYTKSAMTSVTKDYNVIEAYSTKRDLIQTRAFMLLKKECATKSLIIDAINIREVHYPKSYEAAINNKKLAEQEALRLVDVTKQKEELLKQATINKNIAIQLAEGEAKALQIKVTAVASNPKIIELEWISKWNGQLPTYMMGSGQSVIMSLPNK
jgi:regulator of protease activity HflC (stomatin/prohibitin superfamily)